MSTRQQRSKRLFGDSTAAGKFGLGVREADEVVGLVARSRRELLLAAHRHRLGREDLEDCYSQATLEMLARARRGGEFANRAHIGNALEQRFLSRIHDRRRALGGRSPMEAAMAGSLRLGNGSSDGLELADARLDLERVVLARDDLRCLARLSRELSRDQRLVLANQISGEMDLGEFCRTYNWSHEKYRKVAQRARARLLRLFARESSATPEDRCVPLAARVSDQ